MLSLRTAQHAVAVTATALALFSGTTLAVAGTASATPHGAPNVATCETLGTEGVYWYQGQKAGYIWGYYCGDGMAAAVFAWEPTFSHSHANATVRLAVGSAYSSDRRFYGYYDSVVHPVSDGPTLVFYSEVGIHMASPDAWRAGADINESGCIQWSSLHYYGDGSEWDGPRGGCGMYDAPDRYGNQP